LGKSSRVSVIIPAYNAGKSIGRALASVVAQSYTEIEIIVVDDGSTDDTVAVVESFALRDRRIRLVRQANRGVAAARNRGLAEGRSDYIAPLDADDIWLPENLTRQVGALEAAGPATPFSFARSFRIDEHDRLMPGWRRRKRPPPSDYIGLLRNNWVGCGSAAVFRRDAVLSVGGYDESLRARNAQGAEDWKLVLRLASKAPGVAINDSLIGYRVSSAGMSKNLEPMMKSVLLVIEDMRRSGPRIGLSDYWAARSSMLIWLVPRWIEIGEWRRVGHCLAGAYLKNPLWFTQEVAWRLLYRIMRKVFIRSWLGPPSSNSWPDEREEAAIEARERRISRADRRKALARSEGISGEWNPRGTCGEGDL
jgi:glycosyltransferase involved in cell wall biosynthesis